MTPEKERDVLRNGAIRDFLSVISPAIGLRGVVLKETYLQFEYDGMLYRVGGIDGMSPKGIGQCVYEILTTGECDYITKKNKIITRAEYMRMRRNGGNKKGDSK